MFLHCILPGKPRIGPPHCLRHGSTPRGKIGRRNKRSRRRNRNRNRGCVCACGLVCVFSFTARDCHTMRTPIHAYLYPKRTTLPSSFPCPFCSSLVTPPPFPHTHSHPHPHPHEHQMGIRTKQEEQRMEGYAAVVVQSQWRRVQAAKQMNTKKEGPRKKEVAVHTMQKLFRGFAVRRENTCVKRTPRLHIPAIAILPFFNLFLVYFSSSFFQVRNSMSKEVAAILVQSVYRGYVNECSTSPTCTAHLCVLSMRICY